MGSEWEFFINLSGQDFPLMSQTHIQDFLSRNIGNDFIRAANQSKIRPDTEISRQA